VEQSDQHRSGSMSRARLSRLSGLGEGLARLLITGRRLIAASARVASHATRWALAEALQPPRFQGAKSAIGLASAGGHQHQGIIVDVRSTKSPIANGNSGRLNTLVIWHSGVSKQPRHSELTNRNQQVTGQVTDVAMVFRDHVMPTPIHTAIPFNSMYHLPTRHIFGRARTAGAHFGANPTVTVQTA